MMDTVTPDELAAIRRQEAKDAYVLEKAFDILGHMMANPTFASNSAFTAGKAALKAERLAYIALLLSQSVVDCHEAGKSDSD